MCAKDSNMEMLMVLIGGGFVQVEDDDDEEIQEEPKEVRKCDSKNETTKKKLDDDIFKKGITAVEWQDFRDRIGFKEGYTYVVKWCSSLEFISNMRQKLMESGISIEEIVKYLKFYYFSWQGDRYVSVVYTKSYSRLAERREKQTDKEFNENLQKYESLETIFESVIGDMEVARQCGSDGKYRDMSVYREMMLDKPIRWSPVKLDDTK